MSIAMPSPAAGSASVAVSRLQSRAMSRLASSVFLFAALAACGDDGGHHSAIDAAVADTAEQDTLPTNCDYTEQSDATNDTTDTGTAEATGLAWSSEKTLCGNFESSHFDGLTVDADSYTLSVATEGDALIRLAGAADAIAFVGIDVRNTDTDAIVAKLTFYAGHGVVSAHLPVGNYEVLVFALGEEAITATIPYKVFVIPDAAGLRCPELPSGGYPEAGDGASNDGNDVLAIPGLATIALTSSGSDSPEATGLTLTPSNGDQRISGMAANINSPDQYEDKDTYAFATGSTTNELTVRLAWQGSTTNLDYLLFEEGQTDYVQLAIDPAQQGPEAQTFSIKPSTSYWLLIGSKAGASMPAAAYSATLCPAHFVP